MNKTPWLIQLQFDDATMSVCPMHVFRRKLIGTGIEVDRTHDPVHVGRGRFVGRGFATKRAIEKLHGSDPNDPDRSRASRGSGFWLRGPRRLDKAFVYVFEEIKISRIGEGQIGMNA